MVVLSKIYTRTGDAGTTGLGDGSRIPKTEQRIKCMGVMDEVNAAIGVVLSYSLEQSVAQVLTKIQHQLFDLGGELCLPEQTFIKANYVEQLAAEGLRPGDLIQAVDGKTVHASWDLRQQIHQGDRHQQQPVSGG